MKQHQISIIIPILNEAVMIQKLLLHLIDHSSKENIADIIIVDGGSSDGSQKTIELLFSKFSLEREQSNYCLISSSKGRALQMNTGAEFARGDILYFLHADSFPPKDFDQAIIEQVKKGNLAGCFRMQFDHNHWWLGLASWLTKFSWRVCRGGDQSQFITKTLFNDIGGYDENYIIYEDNMLINELYARKEFTVIQKKVKTSARCYKKNGVWRLQFHYWVIYIKKWFGASAEDLHHYYRKNIN